MKLPREILGRLLYVVIGAIIAPVVFTLIFPPKHRIHPSAQAMRIAEILDSGLKSDPKIFSSPEALSKFISNENKFTRDYFTTRDFLLVVVSQSEQIPSFYIMLPGGNYYVSVDPDGKAMVDKVKTTIK